MKLPLAIHCAIKLVNEGQWVVYEPTIGSSPSGDIASITHDKLGQQVLIVYETPERRTVSFSLTFLEEHADLSKSTGVWTLRVGDFDER